MKRFRFKKSYSSYEGTIPEGSDVTILDNGALYFNGGLVHAAYRNVLKKMIEDDSIRNEYLREEIIPINKI